MKISIFSIRKVILMYKSTRTAWRVTQWTEILPRAERTCLVVCWVWKCLDRVQTGENRRFKLQVTACPGCFERICFIECTVPTTIAISLSYRDSLVSFCAHLIRQAILVKLYLPIRGVQLKSSSSWHLLYFLKDNRQHRKLSWLDKDTVKGQSQLDELELEHLLYPGWSNTIFAITHLIIVQKF
jgi:hypothetical protein